MEHVEYLKQIVMMHETTKWTLHKTSKVFGIPKKELAELFVNCRDEFGNSIEVEGSKIFVYRRGVLQLAMMYEKENELCTSLRNYLLNIIDIVEEK